MRNRTGSTLVEQLVVLTIIGIVSAMAALGVASAMDAIAVHAAKRELQDAFGTAREYAVAAGVRTAVRIEPSSARIIVHTATDTMMSRPLRELHSVEIEGTRDSMAYAPSGLGYGAANLRVILRRHAAADTVNVSRLGRVR